MPAAELATGRVGSLTPEEEAKLRQLWSMIFQVCAVDQEEKKENGHAVGSRSPGPAETPKSPERKKRLAGLFSRKNNKGTAEPESVPATPTADPTSPVQPARDGDVDDKYGLNKQYLETLASMTPEQIRATIWAMVKHDHPDALALRFLRARKWDVDKALVMMVSAMSWRARDVRVDDDIMRRGEAGALAQELGEGGANAKEKQLGRDFMAQIRMGKSFIRGVDKMGRPICLVRVRLHRAGDQCEESVERYTVYIIETARMLLTPPVDTAVSLGFCSCHPAIVVDRRLTNFLQCVVFDMTGFSMANMVCWRSRPTLDFGPRH